MVIFNIKTLSVVVGITIIGTTVAMAGPIEDRQEKMKTVGKNMKTVAKMAKGEAEFDGAAAQGAFVAMRKAVEGFTADFPEGTETGGKTEAAPAIFTDRAGFEEKAKALTVALDGVSATAPASLDELKPMLGKVGSNCKGCHEKYRIKKK